MVAANPLLAASISVGDGLAEVVDRLRAVTVQILDGDYACGAGVIWRSDGIVISNSHVVRTNGCRLKLADGTVLQCELLKRDPRVDLVALRMKEINLPTAESRDARTLRAGELVLAVGNPMGVAGAFSVGVLASQPADSEMLLRADIRLQPGNSGGPLADAQGRVIGINSMVVNGMGIAVSSSTVEGFLNA
jgi:serine protease Do